MAARPRIRRRANWPDNLHEPREGYYTWRDPRDKKTHILGRMPLAQAIHEAQEANRVVESAAASKSLAERIQAETHTVADLIDRMPTKGVKKSTLDSRRYIDSAIINAVGKIECSALTTEHIANMLEAVKEKDQMRWAQSIRDRMIAICARGASLGWMATNPASITEKGKVRVKRRRLTLEEFNLVFEKAPEINDWLQNAMLLALVSGQDRSTIARWERSFVDDGIATLKRSKTEVRIAIPTSLRMDAIGMSLADVIARCKSTGVVSKYLIHHIRNQGRAKRGGYVKLGSVSNAFAEARDKAGIIGDDVPTFHEIRSLCKRLYEDQGGVDTKALLGHMTQEMADLYANNRGLAPVKVKVN